MMDILMSETCWAHKKWNKITSDIKLVFYSSTITMMHGPINIRYQQSVYEDDNNNNNNNSNNTMGKISYYSLSLTCTCFDPTWAKIYDAESM